MFSPDPVPDQPKVHYSKHYTRLPRRQRVMCWSGGWSGPRRVYPRNRTRDQPTKGRGSGLPVGVFLATGRPSETVSRYSLHVTELSGRGQSMTQCMVRPCVARGFRRSGGRGLASMYPASRWSAIAPGHHGYQRACELVSGQASTKGHSGHQCSHAPGRPILHLVSPSRRPRRG